MPEWTPPATLATIAPGEMWQRLAASPKQYLLIGESDHRIWQIGASVMGALPVLAQGGFAHLGLEWSRKTLQPAIDAFIRADIRERSCGADLRALQIVFDIFPSAAARANPALRDKFNQLNKALAYTARNQHMQLHALDQLPSFGDFISGEPVARQEAYMRQLVALSTSGAVPNLLPPEELPLFRQYVRRFFDVNMASDKGRAASIIAAAGQQRAMVFYGSAHFRGEGQNGIDAHLPAQQQAYVLIGQCETLAENFPHTEPRRAPDFVLDTANRRAFVMPAAAVHGLA